MASVSLSALTQPAFGRRTKALQILRVLARLEGEPQTGDTVSESS